MDITFGSKNLVLTIVLIATNPYKLDIIHVQVVLHRQMNNSTMYTAINRTISNIIKRVNSTPPEMLLGRWQLEYCNARLSKKIELTNEDHCGPCGTSQKVYMPREFKPDNTIRDIE